MTEIVVELNAGNKVVTVISGEVVPEEVVPEQIIPEQIIPAVPEHENLFGETIPEVPEYIIPERIIPSYTIPSYTKPDVTVVDWTTALKYAAMEVLALNDAMAGSEDMPRPLSANPDAEDIHGFLGDWNGIPSDDGMVLVHILNYEYLNFKFLPQMPTQFHLIGGKPTQAGTVI